MPLRNHFRDPIVNKSAWSGFHAFWPAAIVMHLQKHLPPGFVAEPRVTVGQFFEVDVGALDNRDGPTQQLEHWNGHGGVATATAVEAMAEIEVELPEQYAYEVLIFEQDTPRRLVAAIEIVSPANKDRPENRRAFVGKCAALLREKVSLAIVDLVHVRQFNLYAELLEWLGQTDSRLGPQPPASYAVSLRHGRREPRTILQSFLFPIALGQPLPTLPLWLTPDLSIPVDLEASYEDTCRTLRIEA